MHMGPEPVRIRRMLERPFGSVRWKDDTPDVADRAIDRDHCGADGIDKRDVIPHA